MGRGTFHVFAVKYPFIWLPVTNFSSSLMWSVVEDFSGLQPQLLGWVVLFLSALLLVEENKAKQNKTKLCNCPDLSVHQDPYLTSGPHSPRASLTLSVVFIVLVCFLPVQRKGWAPKREVCPWSEVCKFSESHFTKRLQIVFKSVHVVITQWQLLILSIHLCPQGG